MNTETPRVFIAATRQNDGKTTISLGLLNRLREFYPRVGYIKPVGQRYVEIAESAAGSLGIIVQVVQIRTPADIEPAFSTAIENRLQGMCLTSDGLIYVEQQRLVQLAPVAVTVLFLLSDAKPAAASGCFVSLWACFQSTAASSLDW